MKVKTKDEVEYDKVDARRGIDHIGVCCSFFCHDGKGNVLLQKRSPACRDEHNRWDGGGGCMEMHESFEDTVKREAKEEYGVDAIDIVHVTTFNILREHEGTKTHWICNFFMVEVDRAQARIGEPEKISEIGWFTVDTLPDPLHSGVPSVMNAARAFLQNGNRVL